MTKITYEQHKIQVIPIKINKWLVLSFIRIIRLYQQFAPMKIRKACRFTPCCSEYMRLSIEKYGLVRGIHKGIKRIGRCRKPNGGIDYP